MDAINKAHANDPKEQAQLIAQSIYEVKLYCHKESSEVKDPKVQAPEKMSAEYLKKHFSRPH